MRITVVLFCWLLALTVQGATPEVGKDRLRTLVKLPTISFPSNWQFDPERGFTVGSGETDVITQIANVRKEMRQDDSDAERYLKLADLYSSINDNAKAKNNFSRAAELYRKQVEKEQEQGGLLAKFGLALAGAGRTEEAESILRRAVRIAPKDWECWVALGRFLDKQARLAVYDSPIQATRSGGKTDNAGTDKLSPNQVTQARKWTEEAGQIYEKAVVVAPEEAEVYLRHGLHLCLHKALSRRLRMAAGEESDGATLLSDCFTTETLADLQHASRLSPRDYRLIGGTVIYEIYTVCAEKGQVNWGTFSWNSLPDKTRRSIREAMTRLENLGEGPRAGAAAGALEVLGILEGPVLHEPRSCMATLRRSLALDPKREQAWETLAATLAQARQYDELLATCEQRVRQKDSARSRILLAKAHEKMKQWDECERQIRAALKLDPDDFTANLALADLLLKNGRDTDALSDANGWLARAEYLLNKMTAPQRTQLHMVDLTLARGIYFALTDEMETARRWVKAVIDQDKDNNFAKEILDAMGY